MTQLKGSQNMCRPCGRIFATLTDFDNHQSWTYGNDRRKEWSFGNEAVLECLDPETIGLEEINGVWGTPAGNVHRASLINRVRNRSATESE